MPGRSILPGGSKGGENDTIAAIEHERNGTTLLETIAPLARPRSQLAPSGKTGRINLGMILVKYWIVLLVRRGEGGY